MIMGLPLYTNYYVVHDDANNRMGFGPLKGSEKSELVTGDKPKRIFMSDDPDDPTQSALSWYIIAGCIVLLMGIWTCLIAE